MSETHSFKTKGRLLNYLKDFGIPVETWGRGGAKNVDSLFQEIISGETVLASKEKKLLRQVKVVSVNVIYRTKKNIYKLVEDRQEFADGRIRRRHNPKCSLSEKFKADETPHEAARRALREELGIYWGVGLRRGSEAVKTIKSPSYPGLKTRYFIYYFDVVLKSPQVLAEGYIERTIDMTTYFVWKKRPNVRRSYLTRKGGEE